MTRLEQITKRQEKLERLRDQLNEVETRRFGIHGHLLGFNNRAKFDRLNNEILLLAKETKMIIRAKTFRQWLKANFNRSELEDIANHGANSGWSGLIYYTDTSKLYRKFREDIWDTLWDMADAYGDANVWALVAGTNGADVGSADQAECQLVWIVAEHYAREICYDDNY
jgi:hypothetical protein